MITMNELLNYGKKSFEGQPIFIQENLQILLARINQVREKWDKPMIVTSGLRSLEDHLRIYAEKGITDKTKIPMKSQHLVGSAIDIADPALKLTAWLKLNPLILIDAQLWCEEGNKNWLHAQIVPPKSGNRWFLP